MLIKMYVVFIFYQAYLFKISDFWLIYIKSDKFKDETISTTLIHRNSHFLEYGR